ncbi:alpha/beta hydrolase [Streptomyces sp. N2-109]|uniref:Alpha/beta hydrolase n=1 Tax=Streptomyces gossypii TaxID=2883101 RepID=A0ABT2K2F6_9ACTN|nr:alpha/beta hydrolase [Streptomyces gossypii]MCT2593649.1 alpha/beta hydrolase [Streptomyces gossypii]
MGAALMLCASPWVLRGEPEDARHPRTERTYAYGPHARQQLSVHWRTDHTGSSPAALRPGVVVLHGGYWRQDRGPGWREWSGSLSRYGLVVFDVDYRRNVDARWPAQRADVLAALSWIARRGARFGADPDRLVLLGSSAGGHLATSVGTYGAGAVRVDGVIGLSPVTDPRRAWRDGADPHVRRNAELLAGCPPGGVRHRTDCSDIWWDMSAASHASGKDDAPMLLLHSAHDFVPAAHSRALALAERAQGMPARRITVVTVPGHAHGAALLDERGVTPALLAWIKART